MVSLSFSRPETGSNFLETGMNVKFVLIATVVGGIALFGWGFVSHMFIPWPSAFVGFADMPGIKLDGTTGKPIEEAVRSAKLEDGMYLTESGTFMAVKAPSEPPAPGKENEPPMPEPKRLAVEFGSNLVEAFLLALVYLGCNCAN